MPANSKSIHRFLAVLMMLCFPLNAIQPVEENSTPRPSGIFISFEIEALGAAAHEVLGEPLIGQNVLQREAEGVLARGGPEPSDMWDRTRHWLIDVSQDPRTSDRSFEKELERFLRQGGEPAMEQFARMAEDVRGTPLGAYRLPPIDPSILPTTNPGKSQSDVSGSDFDIPWTREQYEAERLDLMAQAAVQRALGRRIMVNVGIGFVGTANLLACANATTDNGFHPYFALGYQRPSSHSSWKVNAMKVGHPTIKTDDEKVDTFSQAGHDRGNLTATFLQDQAIAIADTIFVETELHVRKAVPRAIERATATPDETLHLLRHIAQVMPGNTTVVIESTVYPGFSLYEALPVVNEELRKRGLLSEYADANLAYGFHRLKPGAKLMDSFFGLERSGAAVTPEARRVLRDFYRQTGIHYRLVGDNITASEFMKDVENASMFGILELMSAFMKSAEQVGVDGWAIIRGISRARPTEHGGFVKYLTGLQVGGYCVPKELAMLINGLQRHFGMSELEIQDVFASRLVAAALSDHRAEDAVTQLMQTLAERGITLSESQIYWAGVSYKEGVADTRMAGTERGLRQAAHLGAYNRATDPAVLSWPELAGQRLGDPESWGHGLMNQEPLRALQVAVADRLTDHLGPEDDAVVLAVRHTSYVGKGKPQNQHMGRQSDGSWGVFEGLDPIHMAARVNGLEGKVVLDASDFLSDRDIKMLLALGWTVRGFGKGHIGSLRNRIPLKDEIAWNEALLRELTVLRSNEGNAYQTPGSLDQAILVIQAKVEYLQARSQRLRAQEINRRQLVWQLRRAEQEVSYAKASQRDLAEKRIQAYRDRLLVLEIELGLRQRTVRTPTTEHVITLELELQAAEAAHRRQVMEQLHDNAIIPELDHVLALMDRLAHALMAVASIVREERVAIPEDVRDVIREYNSLRHLRYGRLDPLLADIDRFIETLPAPAKSAIFHTIRRASDRPDLAIYNPHQDGEIHHPLFDDPQPVSDDRTRMEPSFRDQAPLARLVPATVFVQDESGKLRKLEDPQKRPYRLTTKWIPDLVDLLQDKEHFPVQWSKFSVEVPINLVKVDPSALKPDGSVDVELYEDFMYLPVELRDWLLHEVWGKGYTLSTLPGELQNKIALLMDVNLDSKTVARGRGGVVFWQDTRQPVIMTTPEGREVPLDLKAMGDFRGGDPEALRVQYNRQIVSGRNAAGGTAQTNLGQIAGHMFSADDTSWQERLRTQGSSPSMAPGSVFRVRWRYEKQIEAQPFQMVGRASPSEMRLGNVFVGTSAWDPDPQEAAAILGWNNAEILGHDIAAVHIALNLDNIMTNGMYTDTGSNIDLFTERDPKGTLWDYAGYGPLMAIYTYADMKRAGADRTFRPTVHTEYLQPWFNGFLDHFFELDHGRHVPPSVRQRFEKYRDVAQLIEGFRQHPIEVEGRIQEPAERVIDLWLNDLWNYYVPYQILRNRISRGYDYRIESPFTAHKEDRMFDTERAEKAEAFIRNQRDVIRIARRLEQEEGYPSLSNRFDYGAALQELDQKEALIQEQRTQPDPDYSEVYELSFYKPLEQDIFTIIDPVSGRRLANKAPRPNAFLNKMGAAVSKRARMSGLRVTKMSQRTGAYNPFRTLEQYLAVWSSRLQPGTTLLPEEADIRNQTTVEALMRLVRRDYSLAGSTSDPNLEPFGRIRWGTLHRIGTDLYTTMMDPQGATIYLAITDAGTVLPMDENTYQTVIHAIQQPTRTAA